MKGQVGIIMDTQGQLGIIEKEISLRLSPLYFTGKEILCKFGFRSDPTMKVNIKDIIHDEVARLNKISKEAHQESKKKFKPFQVEDYTYLPESITYFGEFTFPYFLTYSIVKDLEFRVKNPYPGTIWYWKNDVDQGKAKDFLPVQTKLLHDTLSAYMALLKSGQHFQALILFRSYIEYSSQFYASLLDYEFFQKYTGSGTLQEEYKQLWFSSLKPAKVLAKIKAIHTDIDSLLQQKKIQYGDRLKYTRSFRPFDSVLRGDLYRSLSGLAHGQYAEILKSNELNLYALVWLCSVYMVEARIVIDEVASVYYNYALKDFFRKTITMEIYWKSLEPKTEIILK